jgi:hypothetical protein
VIDYLLLIMRVMRGEETRGREGGREVEREMGKRVKGRVIEGE